MSYRPATIASAIEGMKAAEEKMKEVFADHPEEMKAAFELAVRIAKATAFSFEEASAALINSHKIQNPKPLTQEELDAWKEL